MEYNGKTVNLSKFAKSVNIPEQTVARWLYNGDVGGEIKRDNRKHLFVVLDYRLEEKVRQRDKYQEGKRREAEARKNASGDYFSYDWAFFGTIYHQTDASRNRSRNTEAPEYHLGKRRA